MQHGVAITRYSHASHFITLPVQQPTPPKHLQWHTRKATRTKIYFWHPTHLGYPALSKRYRRILQRSHHSIVSGIENSDGPNSYFPYSRIRMSKRIFYFNICECKCEYYTLIFANANIFIFMFITLCDINRRSFYRLINHLAMNKNIYCKSSAIKSLMEFWIQLNFLC